MTSHTSPHILTLPKDLTHKDLLLMDRTISTLSLTDRTIIISLNEPIDHSIWADEHCKFYSSQFLRKVLLIKINSLLREEATITQETLKSLIHLLKEGVAERIEVCTTEEQLFVRFCEDAGRQGKEIPMVDRKNVVTGNCLGLALVADTIFRAELICKLSEIAFAVCFEVLNGRIQAFMPCVHEEKKHEGQAKCARNVRALLTNNGVTSELNQKRSTEHKRVQDSYSLRCVPQVHGISYDVVNHAKTHLEQQLNNPQLAFITLQGQFFPIHANTQKSLQLLDHLSIALHQIGSISIIRSERMLNMFTSKLPFEPSSLPNYPCLRSLYWTCSSKFLQNKTLCYPVSADSLVGDSYTSDISYSLRNMDHKHRVIFKNLLEIVGLELVLGVEVMEGLKGVYKEGLTEQLSKEVELAREFFKTGGQLEREFEGNLQKYLKRLCV